MKKAKIYDARQLPAFLTPKEFGTLMGVCPKTVQRMCRMGELPAYKVGPRLWRIDKNAALERLNGWENLSPAQSGGAGAAGSSPGRGAKSIRKDPLMLEHERAQG